MLANDRDADGNLNRASVQITSPPNKGGTATVRADGKVAYKPKLRFRGVETFRYTVKDKLWSNVQYCDGDGHRALSEAIA